MEWYAVRFLRDPEISCSARADCAGPLAQVNPLVLSYRKAVWLVPAIENGHTVPSVETLEKLARALEVPLYELFYQDDESPKLLDLAERLKARDAASRGSRKEARFLKRFHRVLARMDERAQQQQLHMGAEDDRGSAL